jgi:hypothetical protein
MINLNKMKKIILTSLMLIVVTSCTVKEEFTISDQGKVDYSYDLNGIELKSFIKDQNAFTNVIGEQKDFVVAMKKGMTIESFFTRIQENNDFLKEKNKSAKEFLQNNKSIYEKVKHNIIKVDFKELNYSVELNSSKDNIATDAKLVNDFMFDFFNAIDNPFHTEYINNDKKITNNTVEININKDKYSELVNNLTSKFQNESNFLNLFKYKLIIHTPNKILSSSENGSNFSLDQKTVEFNYTFSQLINEDSKSVKITF